MASVQVAVRVRPFNEREIALDSKCIIRMESNKTIIFNQKVNFSTYHLINVIFKIFLSKKANESLSISPDQYFLKSSTLDLTQPLPPPAPPPTTQLPVAQTPFSQSQLQVKEFIYDYSYWSFDSHDPHFKSQSDVYNNLGTTSVKNSFDGYNTCICAYGQTGSGKSYSMMGFSNGSNLDHEG